MIAEAETTGDAEESGNQFSLDGLIKSFWSTLEANFHADYLKETIGGLVNQDLEQELPEFFITFYKRKIAKALIDKIDQFKLHFMTQTEEDWERFVEEEKKKMANIEKKHTYVPQGVDMDALKAVLSIMVVMPIKADMKHDWDVIETKLTRLQRAWNVTPAFRYSWTISDGDLELRVQRLE